MYEPEAEEALKKWSSDRYALFGGHKHWSFEEYLDGGVDNFFFGDWRETGEDVKRVDPSKFWTQPTPTCGIDGEFICPDGYQLARAYTHFPLKNVHGLFWTKLGDPADGQVFWMGSERGTDASIAGFRHRQVDGTEEFHGWAGGHHGGRGVDLTDALPADAKTALHVYTMVLTSRMAEFYIDNDPVGFILNSGDLQFSEQTYPPYAINHVDKPYPEAMLGFVEAQGGGSELSVPLAPADARWSEAEPWPPRNLRLYETGTTNLLAGMSVDPDVTSHPFPLFGFEGKTISLRADGAGTLDIEVLTQAGNWRTYDSTSISANTLETYPLNGEVALGRVVFTPDSPPATVTDAEVTLR